MAKLTRISVLPGIPVAEPQFTAAVPVREPAPQPADVIALEPRKLGWIATKRRNMDRRALKRDVARIIAICKDHESNGVKAGDPIFQELQRLAGSLCDKYCVKWGVSRKTIEVQLPCLRELRIVAYPEGITHTHPAPLALLGLVACVILPLIIGAWTGLFGVGQHLIHRLFGG